MFKRNQTLFYCIRLNILILLYIGSVKKFVSDFCLHESKHRDKYFVLHIMSLCMGKRQTFPTQCTNESLAVPYHIIIDYIQLVSPFRCNMTNAKKSGNVKIHHNVHCCQLPLPFGIYFSLFIGILLANKCLL